jgi:hypothetical protein
MITIAQQVEQLNAAFGHTNHLASFGKSDELHASRGLTDEQMPDEAGVTVEMAKTDFYARMVRWTSWFVDTVTQKQLQVESDQFGRCVLHGEKEHTLSGWRDASLPDSLELVTAAVVHEITKATELGIRGQMMQGHMIPSDGVVEAYKHLLGGNSEGSYLVTDALGTLFASTGADVPDDVVTRRVFRLGRDVKQSMLNSFGVEKILDAAILTRMDPYAIRQVTADDVRLVFSDHMMVLLKHVAKANKARRKTASDRMDMIFEGLAELPVGEEFQDDIDMFLAVNEVLSADQWDDWQRVTVASEKLLARLWRKPRSLHTPDERLAHMALISLSMCQRNDQKDLTERMGCPLHHTGKFGKWYKHIAMPITDWYLQQRKFA